MKIAMIGQKGLPAHTGGIERHVDDLTVRLISAGHDVTVYCRKNYALNYNYPSRYFGARLVYIPTPESKYFSTVIQTFLATLHACMHDFDLIHYHGIGPSLFAWIPRVFTPHARVIATFHCQDYFHQKWNVLARFVFRCGERMCCIATHRTIVVSRSLKRYVQKTYGRSATYIPNAVPLPERMPAHAIRRWGLSRGSYILSVSRLVRHKSIHTLITAYQDMARVMPHLPTLVIVGGSVHTYAYVKELKRRAEGNEKILFTGELSGPVLSELYSNARLFIQASESEGLSYALLEAMSYGCPVLVSDIAENKEVLPTVGYTFHTKDAGDLSRVLSKILTHAPDTFSPALYYEHVKTHYHIDDAVRKTISLYQHELNAA